MSRRTVLVPDLVRRVRRDPRFADAVRARTPQDDWRARGRCLELDPELFFPTTTDAPVDAVQACRNCVVAGPCLANALETGEVDGVWGATTPDERRVMRQVWIMPTRAGRSTREPVSAGR